jgi:nicotinate-nucleotide--dimethylbenzimidazole phosphoribosyltransferase
MLNSHEIRPIDPHMTRQAGDAVDSKTKPPGSLGRIEALAIQIAGIQQTLKPVADPARLLLFAADHGMVADGVSAWPSEVTTQMVANFLAGGAAANIFARTNDVEITIADAGILGDLPASDALRRANIRKGTRNAVSEDAMTPDECARALAFGADLAAESVANGARTILLGEMGIGNTSSAVLLAHALVGLPITDLTGPGAGLDSDGVKKKIEILERAASRHTGRLAPLDAMAAYGGLELAAMAGALIGAASAGAIVLVDGFIATAAALCALQARPDAAPYCVFAHRSKEPGHRLLLQQLGCDALIDLDLRLGEGTGALLAYPLLRSACAMLSEMATFESAGVSDKVGD